MALISDGSVRVVVISSMIREFITLPVSSSFTVNCIDDICGGIEKIVAREKSLSCQLIVVFLHLHQYHDVISLINRLPPSRFSFRLIGFASQSQLDVQRYKDFEGLAELRCTPVSAGEFLFIVEKSFAFLHTNHQHEYSKDQFLAELTDANKDQQDLINIGRALSVEKDPDKLLRKILHLSKRITCADAGSIYLVESDQGGDQRLRFKYADTFSRKISLEEFTLPMDRQSIAGYVAVTGEILNLPDASALPSDATYAYNPYFDELYQYQSRSMLVVPIKNHSDEIIGVIQLINSKESAACLSRQKNSGFSVILDRAEDFTDFVVPFRARYNSLMEAVAGQAGIAIENNRMLMQIEHQFEEFVRASVFAIESRDPATSGHSLRVAKLCTAIGRAVNEMAVGPLKDYSFSEAEIKELELAALLHDFGKVYVDVAVFLKAKKLYPKNLENLCLRLDYLYRFLELDCTTREVELLRKPLASDVRAKVLSQLAEEKNRTLSRVIDIKRQLIELNEPVYSGSSPEETIRRILSELEPMQCYGPEGNRISILSPQDTLDLSVHRGTLNPEERREIESHVRHTYHFASKIPWPPEYRNIPEIALRHHEKLDGSGYPGGLLGEENIPLPSRIMAIADIFDALTAADRPYKKAVPLEKVLKILNDEAARGVLDQNLVKIFIDTQVYLTAMQ